MGFVFHFPQPFKQVLGLGCTLRALDKFLGTQLHDAQVDIFISFQSDWCEVIVEPHWFRWNRMEKGCQELHMWTRSPH